MARLSGLPQILARPPSRHGILDALLADGGAKGVMAARLTSPSWAEGESG